ncbi:type VII secretion integral membrane protein EccD [Streptomyces sp. XM4193]|uniref:type VII secretion integral membrane protein EccD n=1 Tax=Streptomyces sp. XM4193 TaxID=2929782 RepID=UPI001FF7253D|nr:type VII secretion integral membrane protein EccD [Streptomyces sp. XM4193]MCK1797052.1 type VII secretion integral membrane protein EccD [Streptomyces sp. XM4193]
MPDERCRVTVVGERRRVDLALPARAPIAEYAPRLATMCGQTEPEANPPVWSLAEPGAEPLAPGESLAEAGILDGATLYLHDHRAGELGELTVTDLDDQVADARDDKTLWDGRRRAQCVLGAGLFVMVVSAAWLGAHRLAALAAVLFALAALTVPLLAWYAQRKNWPLPPAVRQILALAACPLMACVGLGAPIQGPTATPVLVAVTAVVGATLALVALPAPSTAVLLALTALAALFVLPLTVLGAGMTGSAAVVAMVLFLLATLLPRVTSQIAVLVPSGPDTGAPLIDNEDVAAVVRRGNGLLTLLSVVTGTALAVSLVVLSSSRGGAGLALAAVVSVGLLLQAGTVRVLTAVVPQLAAGVVGLLALAIRVPEYLFDSPAFGPLAAFGGGAALVVCGLFLAFNAALRPIEPERPTWPGAVTTLLTVASLPLTAAVFGLFGWLANLGGGL